MYIKYVIFFLTLSVQVRLLSQTEVCSKADSLMTLQQYIHAAEAYRECYQRDTLSKKNLAAMANCYMMLGDYSLSKQYYHQIEKDSNFKTEALSKLAIIYESQQNLPKAIKYYIALSKIFPENPVYYRKLGNLLIFGNEQKQALSSFQTAMQLNERDLLSIQGISELYLSLDSLSIADSILTKGLNIDSTNIGLSLLKSRVKYRQRDYQSVAKILHKLTYVTELNNYYSKLLGYSFMQIDSIDKAIYHLQKSLLNEGDPEYALFYLALAYEKKQDYERSDYYYGEAIKEGISENMANYHRGLARTHTIRGNYGKVLKQYEKSLEYAKEADVYFYMANAAEQYYKDKTKAIKYYQQYLEAKPQNTQWVTTAKERIKELKEQRFMRSKSK